MRILIGLFIRYISILNVGHPSNIIAFQYMGSSLYYRRYNVTGRVQDLNMAINTGRSALQALPDNHRYIPRYQTELAGKLVSRFEKQGVIDDINEAINLSKSVAAAPTPSTLPNNHTDKGYLDRYTILSKTLAKRFESTEDDEDLEESIKYARAAASAAEKLGVKPLERQAAHQNLADRAYQRFERTGDLGDLNESIEHGIFASEILTVNTSLLVKDTTKAELANHLTSLSSQHLTRFEYQREAADLDNAVTYARAALDMASQRSDKVPPSAAERYALGIALFRRFEQYGQDDDLEDSLVQSRLAFDLATQQVTGAGALGPGATPISRKTLYQFLLSGVLCARYKRKQEKADLDGAIVHAEAVLRATSKDHPLYDMYYSIYAYAVGAASENGGVGVGVGVGIDQAISHAREEAEKAAAACDPSWGKLMLKLASLQYTRFEQGVEEGRRSSINAGGGLTGDLDLEHAMNAWKKVASGPSSSGTRGAHGSQETTVPQSQALSVRMRAALRWTDAACRHGRMKAAVEAYKVVLDLAPRAAIAGLTSHGHGHGHVAKGKDRKEDDDDLALHTLSLASDAAAAAIQLNQLETAVEFLEQARNALWAQVLGLPSEVDKLGRVNPHLAKHVRELALEQERGSGNSSSSPRSPGTKPQLYVHIPNKTPTKTKTKSKPDLEDRWDATLGTVRAAEEGFGGFMRPWKFETIKDGLPLDGIIVFLNCSQLRCDAIVLTPAGHLHSVPLSNRTNQTILKDLTKTFIQGSRDICEGRITGSEFDRDVLRHISLHLWEAVVKPVTESLFGQMAVGGPRRIWWIPTGAFTWLPIHAAGPPLKFKSESESESGSALGLEPEPETITLTDWASSYAVTLRSLLRPLHGAAQKAMLRTSPTRHILAVGAQPARRTTSLLGGMGTSVQCLKNHVAGMDNVTLVALEGPSQATFMNICRSLKPGEHAVDVLHISLPVHVDPIRLPDSAWVGADGSHIKLADVLAITTSGRDTMPEFAFIASPSLRIETDGGGGGGGIGGGDHDHHDGGGEFLTMAGAMQFSGVGSVVGALWTATTEDSAAIAKRVYARMFPSGETTSPGAVAIDGDERRLDGFVDGVETLRKARVPLYRTMPFVHYGL
jgi:hypothetical protein